MRQLGLRPLKETRALRFEVFVKRFRRMLLDQHGLSLARDIEVHQRQPDPRKISRLAHQPAIDLHLRPMQRAVIGGHAIQVAAIGFELFELVLAGVVTIRAAADVKRATFGAEPDLGLVAFTAT
ncbi:MAG TPA: hypothetical protein VMF89_00865 [Polyangiales bacterium]|nr:hypothetical protein [Polyangiales bacterium]